jgi:aromatic ring-cleaving dioxygenase
MAIQADEFGTGLEQWNLQAWWDFITVKLMMSRVGDVIPKTYMPILRLVSEDAGKVDDEYARVVAMRQPVRLFDSPREKWRKIYGSYIRELDWVYDELRPHFPTREYQDLVQDIMARRIRDAMSAFLPQLEKMTRSEKVGPAVADADKKRSFAAKIFSRIMKGRVVGWLMNNLNPMSFMVGPVEMEMKPGGEIQMFIPRCWMHTAPGDGRTQDQACVQGCKGACERVFNGNTPVAMLFEPHLPDYSCTLHVKMGGPLENLGAGEAG